MATALVTGGAGFIGSHVVEALLERGDRVRVIDNLSTGLEGNLHGFRDRIEFIQGDVLDEKTTARAVAGVDCVFHLAALPSVTLSVEKPLDTHAQCATATLVLLDQARRAGVRRVVYSASSAAYGDQATLAKRESDPVRPLSPYAAGKLAGELYCHAFYHSYGLETVGLRYFNVFGPRQDPDSPYSAVIPRFMREMLAGRRPTIYGDGGQTRDFTYVANVARANLLAADVEEVAGEVFNIADGRSTSLLRLMELLNELLGTKIQPQFDPPRPGDIRHSMADITLASQKLGYEPPVSFEEGLRRSIDYYRRIAS
ncbi:MAG: SDR family oxidoreductase [Planctomycetes bacterium]|nr:SDR family oxidoreductase [Planctomycetota bacterium]